MYCGLWVFFGNCQLAACDCKESQPEAGTAPGSLHWRVTGGTGLGPQAQVGSNQDPVAEENLPGDIFTGSCLLATLGHLYLDSLLT